MANNMTTGNEVQELQFPELPAMHSDFIQYIGKHPDKPLSELLEPFKQYDAELRKAFAQQPNHPVLDTLNVLPVFDGYENDLKIRARNLDTESEKVKESYIMPLDAADRKMDGTLAVVNSLVKFKEQFSLFSESALSDMNWSNVVAAGSSVVTSLLPVPEQYNGSKRAMRQYYHEVFAPASDVDLFIYGLTEEQAIDKIREIEQSVKDALLVETTTVRTKHAITIASQYPVRHIQIVLRIYKSISEILTGFDVDCSCAAFDGKQVWSNPRALVAYMTQTNVIDLSRRSPSYENRLSKYRHRGFEVLWPDLDRFRIDPTIYERSFLRTEGLARLLVLERLPSSDARDSYLDQRRQERGRPTANRSRRRARKLVGDIKANNPDEVAEWVDDEEVSNYHTFTIPYGERYHAAKIERLLFTKDLLMNAEWNKSEDREINLHRHPAFFGGTVDDILHDCCGACPVPATMEEEEVHKKESKIYVSGDMTFIKDDPGRQTIGSFNPLSADDYTQMAYVGNTEMLSRAIVDADVDYIDSWLHQEGNDPNTRDYTGRTPLHLAVMQSTPEVVQLLIDNGARLISRLVDGRTALHLACMRGNLAMVQALLTRSAANEEDEDDKIEKRRLMHRAQSTVSDVQSDSEDFETIDDDDQTDVGTTTENSMINIKPASVDSADEALNDENSNEPDVYNVNIVAWDIAASPLHLAIIKGHTEIVKCLVQEFGADVLLPVKIFDEYHTGTPRAAILTLVLALQLPQQEAKDMTQLLFDLGATCSQADLDGRTAFQLCTAESPDILDTYIASDKNGVMRAINHCSCDGQMWAFDVLSPLIATIEARDRLSALKLLGLGARSKVSYSAYVKVAQQVAKGNRWATAQNTKQRFEEEVTQPIVLALTNELPEVALAMLKDHDIDVNTIDREGYRVLHQEYSRTHTKGSTLLDIVNSKLDQLKAWTPEYTDDGAPEVLKSDEEYLSAFTTGTYQQWSAKEQLERGKQAYRQRWRQHVAVIKDLQQRGGLEEKQAAIFNMIERYRALEDVLQKRGAQHFYKLHPEIAQPTENNGFGGLGHRYTQPKLKTFEGAKFEFKLPAKSDETYARYVELFDATWRCDILAVKELVLLPWTDSENMRQPPLQVAVQDTIGLSPFAIAVLHGHLELANVILELSKAQYSLEDDNKSRVRTRLRGEGDSEADDDEDSDSDIELATETINDNFTIDNIGEMIVETKCSIRPTTMMQWSIPGHLFNPKNIEAEDKHADMEDDHSLGMRPTNLIQWAVWQKDAKALAWLLETAQSYVSTGVEDGSDNPEPSITIADFQFAMRANDTHMVGIIIERTAAGIPLKYFVDKSGIETAEKSRYYQGLSVRGKKKKEWALRGHNQYVENSQEVMHPPLLEAAHEGSLEMVEWFSTEAPLRCYKQYAIVHPEDKRVKHLQRSKDGFENMVSNFLDTRTELALHCALLSNSKRPEMAFLEETSELIQHLIRQMPDSVNLKSEDGITPLHIAFAKCHVEHAKSLIEAGADQTARDKQGRNIIHHLLTPVLTGYKSEDILPIIRMMLDLIDKRLLRSLFEERTAAVAHTRTPLASWLSQLGDHAGNEAQLCRMLLEVSQGAALDLIDGQGHTPLHIAVQRANYEVCKVILEHNPRLINRENATGRTPYEQVEDRVLSEYFSRMSARQRHYRVGHGDSIVNRDSEKFLTDFTRPKPALKRIWKLMQETRAQLESNGQSQRVLVSLNEANEVARRLAAQQQQSQLWYRKEAGKHTQQWLTGDEVKCWMSGATSLFC